MISFTVLRSVALALLPLAWPVGWLSSPLLLVVTAGVTTVFATLAEQALVPELVAVVSVRGDDHRGAAGLLCQPGGSRVAAGPGRPVGGSGPRVGS